MKIVGITACTAGIAHTYLVKEKLVNAARELGHEIKIETQGSCLLYTSIPLENYRRKTTLKKATFYKYVKTIPVSYTHLGSVIRVSVTARPDSDFQGTVSVETKTILKKSQQAPVDAPTEIESGKKDDHALVVKLSLIHI